MDLGIDRPRHRRMGRRQIPRAAAARLADAICLSRSGVAREEHSGDKDGRCVFCDQRVSRSRQSPMAPIEPGTA